MTNGLLQKKEVIFCTFSRFIALSQWNITAKKSWPNRKFPNHSLTSRMIFYRFISSNKWIMNFVTQLFCNYSNMCLIKECKYYCFATVRSRHRLLNIIDDANLNFSIESDSKDGWRLHDRLEDFDDQLLLQVKNSGRQTNPSTDHQTRTESIKLQLWGLPLMTSQALRHHGWDESIESRPWHPLWTLPLHWKRW